MAKSFYIFSNGSLKRKDNTIFLESESGKRFIPVEDTLELHVFGEVDFTKKFLEFASQKEIIIHFYNTMATTPGRPTLVNTIIRVT